MRPREHHPRRLPALPVRLLLRPAALTRFFTCGSGFGVVEITTCGASASRRQNHSTS
ncbi:hypothetical protein ACFVW1_18755 [Streptomyces olivochromogenes]|uniref:hypothetical protein n=1 Tax=Streptomyces olivochromogenes TaxID=1963 RepID=UPI0036DA876B